MLFSSRFAISLAWLTTSFLASTSLAHAAPSHGSKSPAHEAVAESYEAEEDEEVAEAEPFADEYEESAAPEGARDATRKTWLSLGIAGDFAWVSGKNVCMLESQRENGYSCFRDSSSGKLEQYYGEPVIDEGNAISPGFRLRTGRVLLGLDQALGENLTLGGRLGFAFGGGPQGENDAHPFLPLHLEGRVAYWFGDNPMGKKGFRPYAFAAAGLAQVDSRTRVSVVEDTRPSHQPDNPEEQVLVVWKKMGQGFAGLGGGLMYALSETSGIVVEVKGMMMFPSSGFVLEPTIGYAIGL